MKITRRQLKKIITKTISEGMKRPLLDNEPITRLAKKIASLGADKNVHDPSFQLPKEIVEKLTDAEIELWRKGGPQSGTSAGAAAAIAIKKTMNE